MPRSVYFQSPGNPIQRDRLPAEPMDINFACCDGDEDDEREAVRSAIVSVICASLIGQTIGYVDLFAGSWILDYPILLVCVAILAPQLMSSGIVMKIVVSSAMLFVLTWFELRLPWQIEMTLPILAATHLGREIARNYVFLSTASPLDCDAAWNARNAAGWHTMASSLLLCPLIIAICLPPLFLPCLLLTQFLILGVVFVRGDSIKEIARAYLSALRYWCAYNIDGTQAPGLLQSPCGWSHIRRRRLTCSAFLAGFLGVRTTLILPMIAVGTGFLKPIVDWFVSLSPLFFLLHFVVLVVFFVLTPVVLLLVIIFIVGLPVFGRHRFVVNRELTPNQWEDMKSQISQSSNEIVRDSIYQGRMSLDGSPVMIPRSVFQTPVHIAGDTGTGKTARGIMPLTEQLLSDCRSSLVMIDMKGDSHELLATLKKSADDVSKKTGRAVPVRYFTTLRDHSTFAFNPFMFECWPRLTIDQQADIICGALGLLYGTGYGEGHYSTANVAFLQVVLRHFPNIQNFGELAERMRYSLGRPKAVGIDDSIKKDGSHVRRIVDQLAAVAPLNIASRNTPSDDVVKEVMDPAGLFQHPEIHYFHLSSTLGPGSSAQPMVDCSERFRR